MKRLIAATFTLAVILAFQVFAGESRYLGAFVSPGTSVTNQTTTTAFWIPFGSKLTMECSREARILTDSTSVSVDGVRVAGDTLFPTSVSAPLATQPDSGWPTAVIAVISTQADAGVTCDLWQRSGTE